MDRQTGRQADGHKDERTGTDRNRETEVGRKDGERTGD